MAVETTIAPMLSVQDVAAAVDFYDRAFGATEVERTESPDGSVAVVELEIDGARFFVATHSPDHGNLSPEAAGGTTVRIELTVADPDAVAARAIAAGATEMFPVEDRDYGYRQGRVVDAFGHHWLVGRPS